MQVDKARLAQLRYRARTDLYWLATEILGADRMVERVHRPVADFFVQKKPGKPFEEQDTPDRKQRALYDPRGHYKTTMMRADIIQWILNFPDIRIFLGSGKLDQASESLIAIKEQFQNNKKLRSLFPECCPPAQEEWGTQIEFTVPNRTKVYAEPTVKAFSLESIKAGPHCDVLYLDDAVHQDNIGTAEQLQKTIDRYVYIKPIPDPKGYVHIIGTPYSDGDLYAFLEEKAPRILKFPRRPAWTVTNRAWKEGTPLTGEDVELLFPEQFDFHFLNEIREANPYIFNCQYLLDPTPRDTATFTRAQIESHTIPHHHIPKLGTVIQTWDTATSQRSHADYSASATGLYDTRGNLFILDVSAGRYSPFELVNQIIHRFLKWRPHKVAIEEAAGAKMLLPALEMMMQRIKKRLPLDWIPTSPLKSKAERILSLQPLLSADKLYFSAAIPKDTMDELYRQFTKFPKFLHDDIPDAISQLLIYRNLACYSQDEDDEPTEPNSVSYTDDDSLMGAGIVG